MKMIENSQNGSLAGEVRRTERPAGLVGILNLGPIVPVNLSDLKPLSYLGKLIGVGDICIPGSDCSEVCQCDCADSSCISDGCEGDGGDAEFSGYLPCIFNPAEKYALVPARSR
jgi:hypothetical protein